MDKNILTLAYLGDSVYEIYIRKFLVDQGIVKVKQLQKEAVQFVSATAQEKYLHKMMEDSFLTEEELGIVNRARNHKVGHKPKNASIVTYKYATGLEAVIGYYFLKNDLARIEEIMNFILKG